MKIYDTSFKIKQSILTADIGFQEGIWIDIFPLMGFDSPEEARPVGDKLYSLYAKTRLATFAFKKGNSLLGTLGRFAFYIPAKIKGAKPYINAYVKEEASHSFAGKKLAMQGTEPSKLFPIEYFAETIELEFEGKRYPAPAEYDKLLTISYGDWHQLPPESERNGHGIIMESEQ